MAATENGGDLGPDTAKPQDTAEPMPPLNGGLDLHQDVHHDLTTPKETAHQEVKEISEMQQNTSGIEELREDLKVNEVKHDSQELNEVGKETKKAVKEILTPKDNNMSEKSSSEEKEEFTPESNLLQEETTNIEHDSYKNSVREEKVEEIEPPRKMYNDNLPEGRSAHKEDEIDQHFNKYPWVLGALGRVFNFSSGMGPKFAPINIPVSRRLQTFAVLFWMSTFLFMGAGSLFFLLYLFFFTKYWWVSLCYFTWYMGDRSICNRGGRRWNWLRKWNLWRHYRDFFPVHLVKTCELDPSKNYIMGYHPHGILSAGAFANFATEGTDFSKRFPGFTPHLLTLEGHFHLPFYREFFMASGAVSATRESMDYLLGREGSARALCLVVGGAKESLDCHPGQVILHLSKRKGFCKMALRHGASLVPMFSFGENEVYDQVANPDGSLIRRIQNYVQGIIGLAPCMFIGRGVFQYSFGIVPFRKPIYTVVGTPIDVPLVKNPSKEQIVRLHETYVNAVVELYNKYKDRYSEHPDTEIVIV